MSDGGCLKVTTRQTSGGQSMAIGGTEVTYEDACKNKILMKNLFDKDGKQIRNVTYNSDGTTYSSGLYNENGYTYFDIFNKDGSMAESYLYKKNGDPSLINVFNEPLIKLTNWMDKKLGNPSRRP